jgi:hypothetical protein
MNFIPLAASAFGRRKQLQAAAAVDQADCGGAASHSMEGISQ